MKIFQYLFFLYHDMVTVIEYDKQSEKKFSYITAQGEKTFPIMDDFWEWWKGQASYISGELVDFCFIYDKEYDVISDDFAVRAVKPDESCWTENAVKDFLTTMLEHTHIILIDSVGNEMKVDKSNIEFLDNTPKTFYTNMVYDNVRGEDGKASDGEKGSISPLAEYYRALLLSERQ